MIVACKKPAPPIKLNFSVHSLPSLNVLNHDLVERLVEEQNFITSGMQLLDEYAVLKILNGFPGLGEVEYLQ